MDTMSLRKLARSSLATLGFKVSRVPHGVGGNAFADMKRLIGHDHPLIFDVGANIGQSVELFRSYFAHAQMHSFEPSPSVFQKLKENTGKYKTGQHAWNCALGSSNAQLQLLENRSAEWTSFLKPSSEGVGAVTREVIVPVRTVDEFCHEQNIRSIDILKSDTQGFDLEVLKGATEMFARNAVRLVYCELIIANLYEGMPPFGDVCNFLTSHGFELVSFYDISYARGLASWTDGLFIHRSTKAAS